MYVKHITLYAQKGGYLPKVGYFFNRKIKWWLFVNSKRKYIALSRYVSFILLLQAAAKSRVSLIKALECGKFRENLLLNYS